MNYLLFDDLARYSLFPLSLTRPVADIRIGITTIREKWEDYLGAKTSSFTENYLQKKYPAIVDEINILINGSVIPNGDVCKEIEKLEVGRKLIKNEKLIALKMKASDLDKCLQQAAELSGKDFTKVLDKWEGSKVTAEYKVNFLQFPWDIFVKNGLVLKSDFERITEGRKSAKLSQTNRITGENLFIEEGARVEHAIINTETGPVYIGKNAEIMEGSMIRGPFALCDSASVKMGAKIYGPTTIGPYSKVGGEISNCVVMGYSNKGHDGFIGNSVIGEWCNLGADTNCSNLKNNYGKVKVWDYTTESSIDTGLQFCGLLMGDHSKCGINTMFNTGTVVGVNCNIYGAGFPPKFIPSYVWGGDGNWTLYQPEKAIEVASRMMERRKLKFSREDEAVFDGVLKITGQYRRDFLE